jgi:hypothetical protein
MTIADQNAVRLEMIEKRMDKYDTIIDELKEVVIELKTRTHTNYMWLSGLLGISCAILGGLIGHIVH